MNRETFRVPSNPGEKHSEEKREKRGDGNHNQENSRIVIRNPVKKSGKEWETQN